MISESEARANDWLNGPCDTATKEEIRRLMRDPKALNEAFGVNLAFGTGGMRGLMGIGTSRLNRYTIQIATQGLARYLLKSPFTTLRSVFIGYDSRHHSEEFAHEAAAVLAGNGITVYLCSEIRPTPFISFGVRHKKCQAGIMITASHNPKEYNGYKVYWSDGGQIVPPHDNGIVDEVNKIKSLAEVKRSSDTHPLIQRVDPLVDEAYYKEIVKLQLDPRENHKVGDALKITYTPLHGTGLKLLPKALKLWGFSQLNLVEAQIVPDGDFPTAPKPNPENRETLELGLKQLEATRSDLLLVTDPDADRVAVGVWHRGKAIILTGNQIAAICCEYICSTLKKQNRLPPNGALVTTIVSSDLIPAIAKNYNIRCFEVLTGFKYIGQLIHLWEEKGNPYTFLFGAEESYGYLMGTYTRDKDAIITSCLMAEIALLMKVEGRTLIDYLEEIFKKYGVFAEGQTNFELPPTKESLQKMHTLMQKLRQNPPKEIEGEPIEIWEDYSTGQRHYLKTHKTEKLTLPQTDAILMRLSNGSKLAIRPSGTEPKLKIYGGVHLKTPATIQEANQKLESLLKAARKLLT